IVHRREIAAAPDPERHALALSERYLAEHQHAHAAACDGFVDEVIEPHETRARVAGAFGALTAHDR
ncbi:MAG TPA: methylmalonyl-CoA carboxyltransferase, partial [Solirubrobacterales bacterium]|nr:methylmalonyl-CoA carboxyltransferase [Solirubrobacterales bacterium]